MDVASIQDFAEAQSGISMERPPIQAYLGPLLALLVSLLNLLEPLFTGRHSHVARGGSAFRNFWVCAAAETKQTRGLKQTRGFKANKGPWTWAVDIKNTSTLMCTHLKMNVIHHTLECQ